jgi:hypothetical protein
MKIKKGALTGVLLAVAAGLALASVPAAGGTADAKGHDSGAILAIL